MPPDRHPSRQRQRAEIPQDQLHSGQQLPVSGMLDGRLAEAVQGQRCAGRRVAVEQRDEAIERRHPSLARPQDSILERVRDPEQKVGDADLIARRFRQYRDRQRERAARLLQQVVNDGHSAKAKSPLAEHNPSGPPVCHEGSMGKGVTRPSVGEGASNATPPWRVDWFATLSRVDLRFNLRWRRCSTSVAMMIALVASGPSGRGGAALRAVQAAPSRSFRGGHSPDCAGRAARGRGGPLDRRRRDRQGQRGRGGQTGRRRRGGGARPGGGGRRAPVCFRAGSGRRTSGPGANYV